ncbi:MAG: B12-binding domain-containing radical SAM protein [Bacillota bacterium]
MKVLLVKCHKRTIFSRVEPIVTEPLELEYLSAILNRMNIPHRIYDALLEGGTFHGIFQEYKPDVLVLSGYITAVQVIKEYAEYSKGNQPNVKVVVGGVHAEVNMEDFFSEAVDVIIHSDGVNTFERVMRSEFAIECLEGIQGIAYQDHGSWRVNQRIYTDIEKLPIPDRSYFYQYKDRTKYLEYCPVAIVKTALSCPFQCSFCYCKLLNMGRYSERSVDSVIEELKGIEADVVWIVDDSFLLDRKRIQSFIHQIEENQIHKKFIAYSRVDFIAKNGDIIKKLKDIGFVELIVGMEAVDDHALEEYNKHCSAFENRRTVEIMERYGLRLTALFIAGIDFTKKDFFHLRRWIRKMKLESYTLSVFTPIKGIAEFEKYRGQIQTWDYEKWDFLHLVMKPTRMKPLSFYFQFYLVYAQQLVTSSLARRVVWQSIKKLIGGEGNRE